VFHKQRQQRVAVGPRNAHFISIRQVSSDAVTLQLQRPHFYAAAAAAVTTAAAVVNAVTLLYIAI